MLCLGQVRIRALQLGKGGGSCFFFESPENFSEAQSLSSLHWQRNTGISEFTVKLLYNLKASQSQCSATRSVSVSCVFCTPNVISSFQHILSRVGSGGGNNHYSSLKGMDLYYFFLMLLQQSSNV